MKSKPHVAIVGAGAFGGWTALHLLERGARVTLLDAWGPGNSRASSGGETRIMRGTYGPNQPYTRLAARALEMWAKYERRWKRQFLHRSGVLWMVSSRDDAFERGSLAMLREAGITFQELSTPQMKKRWPQVNFADVQWGIFEPECGYLDARASCQAVVDAFVGGGGAYRQVAVSAAGDSRFTDAHLPVWGDHGKRFFYGIPGSDRRGFKVADDTRGAAFDPTSGERVITQATLKRVREYLALRFPAMKDAPLLETRVCQYEQTFDSNFILDRHPRMDNVWTIGGGSGHGFKHGPAVGEMMAELLLKDGEADAIWRMTRFKKQEP